MGKNVNIENVGTSVIPNAVRGFGNEIRAQSHSYPVTEVIPRGPIRYSEVVGVEAIARVEDDLDSETEMVSMQSMTVAAVVVDLMVVLHL